MCRWASNEPNRKRHKIEHQKSYITDAISLLSLSNEEAEKYVPRFDWRIWGHQTHKTRHQNVRNLYQVKKNAHFWFSLIFSLSLQFNKNGQCEMILLTLDEHYIRDAVPLRFVRVCVCVFVLCVFSVCEVFAVWKCVYVCMCVCLVFVWSVCLVCVWVCSNVDRWPFRRGFKDGACHKNWMPFVLNGKLTLVILCVLWVCVCVLLCECMCVTVWWLCEWMWLKCGASKSGVWRLWRSRKSIHLLLYR